MYEVRILLMKGLVPGRFHAAAAAAAAGTPQGTSLQTPAVVFASWLTCGVRMLVPISKPMCFRVSCQPSMTLSGCHISVGSWEPGPSPRVLTQEHRARPGNLHDTNSTGIPHRPGQEPLCSEHPESEVEAVSLGLLCPKGQLVVAGVRASGEISGFKDFFPGPEEGLLLKSRRWMSPFPQPSLPRTAAPSPRCVWSAIFNR